MSGFACTAINLLFWYHSVCAYFHYCCSDILLCMILFHQMVLVVWEFWPFDLIVCMQRHFGCILASVPCTVHVSKVLCSKDTITFLFANFSSYWKYRCIPQFVSWATASLYVMLTAIACDIMCVMPISTWTCNTIFTKITKWLLHTYVYCLQNVFVYCAFSCFFIFTA